MLKRYKIVPTLGKMCLVVPRNITYEVFRHAVFMGHRKECEAYCEVHDA